MQGWGTSETVNANELKALCSAWPGVATQVKQDGDLEFTVAGKRFAVSCLRVPERGRVSFKVDAERSSEFCSLPGIVATRFASHDYWVTVVAPERFTAGEIGDFVRHSYELVRAGLTSGQLLALDTPGDVRASASRTATSV